MGTDRVVEPATVTDDEWAYICVPQGELSELYNLHTDPRQHDNVIDAHPEVARSMREAWVTFLRDHGASEDRIRPFVEGQVDTRLAGNERLYAFRDDRGQWIAFPTENEARAAAYRSDAPGPERDVAAVTFERILEDDPQNLVHIFDQFYWARDLA